MWKKLFKSVLSGIFTDYISKMYFQVNGRVLQSNWIGLLVIKEV